MSIQESVSKLLLQVLPIANYGMMSLGWILDIIWTFKKKSCMDKVVQKEDLSIIRKGKLKND